MSSLQELEKSFYEEAIKIMKLKEKENEEKKVS